jgi:DNA topoisomerase VI subunit A
VLRIQILVRDWGKKSGLSGIRDEHPRSFFQSLETVFGLKIIKFFDADPDPGSRIFLNLDPGWENSHKHLGSATLLKTYASRTQLF